MEWKEQEENKLTRMEWKGQVGSTWRREWKDREEVRGGESGMSEPSSLF